MDEKIPDDVNDPQVPEQVPAPSAHDGEDAQQFSKWMAEYGRPALIGLAVAVVVLLGIQVWRSQKESQAAAAVQALFQSNSPEELQQLASADPEAPTAPMALASAAAEFYAQNRYDEAMAAYQRFLSLYPAHMLVPEATVGVAASLEALDSFEEAAASYEAFAQAHPSSPLQPQAVFGAARCLEQIEEFAEARALYEDFIAANPDSSWLPQAESGLLFLKKAERARNAPPSQEAVSDSSRDAAAAENVAVEEAAPVVEKENSVPAEPPPQKKKSSKKKKTPQPSETAGEGAGEPATD